MINQLRITHCRGCGQSINSSEILFSLGEQSISSQFPESPVELDKFKLDIIRCAKCSLVQLNETVPPEKLYTSFGRPRQFGLTISYKY